MHRKTTRFKFKLSLVSLEHMKDNGLMIRDTDMDTRCLQMVMYIKVAFVKVNRMVKGYIHGQMGKYMRVNGKWELKRVQVFGKVLLKTLILVNGLMGKQKDMEFIYGKIKINMRESGRIIKGMVMEVISLVMVISMQDNMLMINLKGMANTNGQMVLFTLAILKMV